MADFNSEDPDLLAKYEALLEELGQQPSCVSDPHLEMKMTIFDHIPMPVWACDRNCKIVFWNDSAARLYDYSAEEAIGKNFVDLFVNDPEKERACADCIDIIDNNKIVRNMADDKDKHGITKKLVTHCFPVYNVGSYAGLQVEISYEVQDVERLQAELRRLQEQSHIAQEEAHRSHQKLMDLLQGRALEALASVVGARRDDFRTREMAITSASLTSSSNKQAVLLARAEVKAARDRLISWEASYRKRIVAAGAEEDLEELIVKIEREDDLDA